MEEKTLYESHPLMLKGSPSSFIFAIILTIVSMGFGIIVFLIWWLKAINTTLTVTNERVMLKQGILSKHTNEIYLTDVRNIQVYQGVLQRIFKTGAIGISSAGQSGIEIAVGGIPDLEKVKRIIDENRRTKSVQDKAAPSVLPPVPQTPPQDSLPKKSALSKTGKIGCLSLVVVLGLVIFLPWFIGTIADRSTSSDPISETGSSSPLAKYDAEPEGTQELVRRGIELSGGGYMAEGARLFTTAAEQGNINAQFLLGCCYDKGVGVLENKQEAIKWLRKCQSRGEVCIGDSAEAVYIREIAFKAKARLVTLGVQK